MKIFLEAGHGGTDPGALAYDNTKEANYTIELRNLLAKELCETLLDDNYESLESSIERINTVCTKDDLAISIHFNYNNPKASGCEVFISKYSNSSEFYNFAQTICATIAHTLNIPNRGVKLSSQTRFGRLGILDDTICEALLIEVCFLNETDLIKYKNNKETLVKNISNDLYRFRKSRTIS